MASVLKRKRGPVEIAESLKRSKSTKKPEDSASIFNQSKAGWDASFGPLKAGGELTAVNGNNGNLGSPEAEDYEEYTKQRRRAARSLRKQTEAAKAVQWKTSAPIGGRMVDVDPVFTEDEKYLIVAHRQTLEVYSTANSLLNRSIQLPFNSSSQQNIRIVSYALSNTDSNLVWVGCSDGTVLRLDWTTGEGASQGWVTSSMGIIHMSVASMISAGRQRDVVFTTEARRDGGWKITAHEFSPPGSADPAVSRTIYTSTQPIQLLSVAKDGGVVVAASENRVLVGRLRSADFDTVNKIKYEFWIFESTDYISCLDFKVTQRDTIAKVKKQKAGAVGLVDVVVGDVKGAIFVHNDLLGKLIQSQSSNENQNPISLMPKKIHWHRKAVQSIKWSLDGNYVISGGSETVMVLWQLDTGREQFLPHMSAAIQNIVVSPRGSSYAIRLADNSTMVMSTSELKPTANIAGIQAHVLALTQAVDSRVLRVKDEQRHRAILPRIPALINPSNTSRLLLAIGESQEVNPMQVSGAPYLQTFDIASFHAISRQALTRTNTTNINIAPNAHALSESRVTHMQVSHDGVWLATVDEWTPPQRDFDFLGHSGVNVNHECRNRREVFLKFWQWSKSGENWELVSRIDAPHSIYRESHGAGKVLDLAVDPNSSSFSTVGEDGVVCVWRPRTRTRDGVIVKGSEGQPLCNWTCHQKISLGSVGGGEDSKSAKSPQHGCVAFSDDGSILAAALSGSIDGLVSLLDPSTGTIRSSHAALYKGNALRLAMISKYLVIISDDLRVYDLVMDELHYGVAFGTTVSSLVLEQKAEMIHLTVDRASQTFAVTLPCISDRKTLSSAYSEIAVFDPREIAPLLTQTLPYLATAVVPAVGSPGYVILDAAAEITTISPRATQTVTSTAKPMVELQLDLTAEEEPKLDLLQLAEETEAEEDNQVMGSANGMDVDEPGADVDDDGPAVVSQQRLTSVFDIGPSFAMPPIEELFYQVANLFSSKPVAQGA